MASVWLVRNLDLDAARALKLLSSSQPFDPVRRARFRREARVMASLSHPGAVIVYSAQMSETMACIEMEYVKGRSLDSITGRGVTMPPDVSIRLAGQLCDVLQAAHDVGVVHRDLKPGNLILAEAPGGAMRLKVFDFGIANVLGSEDLDLPGTFVGTPQYASPEQVRGEPADARSDLYAVGVILYVMLTGFRPFEGSPTQVLGGIISAPPPPFAAKNPSTNASPELEAVVMRCLAKDPADRFASAHELAKALKEAASSTPPFAASLPSRSAAAWGERGSSRLVATPRGTQSRTEARRSRGNTPDPAPASGRRSPIRIAS